MFSCHCEQLCLSVAFDGTRRPRDITDITKRSEEISLVVGYTQKQECIPVGCVPPASVAIWGGGGVCLRLPAVIRDQCAMSRWSKALSMAGPGFPLGGGGLRFRDASTFSPKPATITTPYAFEILFFGHGVGRNRHAPIFRVEPNHQGPLTKPAKIVGSKSRIKLELLISRLKGLPSVTDWLHYAVLSLRYTFGGGGRVKRSILNMNAMLCSHYSIHV